MATITEAPLRALLSIRHRMTGWSSTGFLAPLLMMMAAAALAMPRALEGQSRVDLFPEGQIFPRLLAGPRDPVSSARILGVLANPNRHDEGVEVEVSLGDAFPVFLYRGAGGGRQVVIGIEAGVFARFGLQVLERELIGTDWVFAVPVLWPGERGWVRLRYYHSSSHMGDEYARRFEEPGVNFSRDAADLFAYRQVHPLLGFYGGVRFGYNVHPEESGRWVLRGGVELEALDHGKGLLPYVAADLEWDEDTAPDARLELRAGFWLPSIQGRRTLRFSVGFLTGPSPLGQFQKGTTTQIGLGLQGYL